MILRTVPGLSFCLVTDSSRPKRTRPGLYIILPEPYITAATSSARAFLPVSANGEPASAKLAGGQRAASAASAKPSPEERRLRAALRCRLLLQGIGGCLA